MERNIRKSILFIGLTFFVSWLIAILFFILGGKWSTPIATVVGVVYMFVPMTIAIIVQKFIYMVVKGGNDLIVGGTGLSAFIVLALVNLGIVVYDNFCGQRE